MKTVWKIFLATGVLAGSLWAGSLLNVTADGASVGSQPGTADDPVVTKSYVDQQIQKALQGGGTAATQAPVATAAPAATAAPVATTAPVQSGEAVEIVDVKPGQTLIAGAGAEFIVRAGKAVIFSQDSNGVADLTAGVDLLNGVAAPSNHLLSFPRDGRGISVQAGQTLGLVVMVRGSYTLK
ncbi:MULTISPECIES: hypothetical protein [unclassified Paenibacillus]|uniref:hypothetical protein n=1 Tax=unclassified Paenibacillus TaxID=185978 RepID=UPI0024056BD1|nr:MULTISPECIES: hypothetical protein [unclassified Paenibacillus]MDF9840122.1 hypothetical protein [Paenibacillus sp. PastF-2]MDF9846704.1 hypothetical protein [Paenibacillus sp. PastM-2]MDF9852947.1 hypothetical protein [Paenibacillus sp. PastF-1]MDH6478548.1 hypothetical protein [Paenibacillus sp. PastH-2]MDH6505954.1 hypothetical protein [Paenibacillus sp. PastM-3]